MLAKVVHRLLSRRGDWPTVARESGVPYTTLTHIAQGHSRDPRISTVQALHDYFEEHPAPTDSREPAGATH